MFINARTLPAGTELRADVCIIGAGPAGITLAREFIGTRWDICVLESGGLDLDPAVQDLARGDNIGFPYYDLQRIRARVFGGCSIHWGGACRPLDSLDLQRRDWVKDSGWPLTMAQLDPYYARAHVICQLGPYDYDLKNWAASSAGPLALRSGRVETAIAQFSVPPTRFGLVYREEIRRAANIRVYLYGDLVEIETTPNALEVYRLRASCLGGNHFSVRARVCVLAAGGIENARILLASDRRQPGGLGNAYDMVGRYFMDHLTVPGAVLLASRDGVVGGLYRT